MDIVFAFNLSLHDFIELMRVFNGYHILCAMVLVAVPVYVVLGEIKIKGSKDVNIWN